MRFLFLLLAFPMTTMGQSFICTIHVVVNGSHEPSQAYLHQAKTPGKSFDFTGGMTIIQDTVDHPLIATVLITYKGEGNRPYAYAFYAVPGELTMHINRDDTDKAIEITGPQLSQDYQNQLLGPVLNYNHQISLLQKKLTQVGADSTEIRAELNKEIALCFGVPKTYVRKHPDSPLDMIALRMLGKGDPTIPNHVGELSALFHSLAPDIQNSEEGKLYGENLEKLSGL
jgi:hypothetical protein